MQDRPEEAGELTPRVQWSGVHGLPALELEVRPEPQAAAHTLPDTTPEDDVKGMTGCYEAEACDDPLYTPWFEAGPQRLTIIRDGRVVHNGGAR